MQHDATLARLEREVRFLRRYAAASLLNFLLLSGAAFQPEQRQRFAKRLFAGEGGRTSLLRLNDTRGRPRIRLMVDSLDVPGLEFLDAQGSVVHTLPEAR